MQSRTTISLRSTSIDLVVSSATDVGGVRAVNEDSFFAAMPVFLVADGMGGHNAGDQASQTVRETFRESFPDRQPTTTTVVLDVIQASNNAVRQIQTRDSSPTAISGTTLAGVALVEEGEGAHPHWMIFNIGDSRVYSWDGRELQQLSVDHSAVQELVDSGVISSEQAAVHPERNIITRAIGASEFVDPDVWLRPVGGAQAFLMCSDGLTKELDDAQIARLLAEHDPGNLAISVADALVAAALAAGGKDNITAVVVESQSQAEIVEGENTVQRMLRGTEHLEDTRPRI